MYAETRSTMITTSLSINPPVTSVGRLDMLLKFAAMANIYSATSVENTDIKKNIMIMTRNRRWAKKPLPILTLN
jgi:hypothetical protein